MIQSVLQNGTERSFTKTVRPPAMASSESMVEMLPDP